MSGTWEQIEGPRDALTWPTPVPPDAVSDVEALSFVKIAYFAGGKRVRQREILIHLMPNQQWTDELRSLVCESLERHTPAPKPCEECAEKDRRMTQARQYAVAIRRNIGNAEAHLRTAAGDALSITNILSGPGDTESTD